MEAFEVKKVLILGAAGFLGSHLEHRLKAEGNYVVSVARKHPPYRKSVADEYNILDLANVAEFHAHFHRHRFDEIFQLAGNVGGLGYIGTGEHDAAILTDSLKINLYTLEAMRKTDQHARIFFASSQCVYPEPGIDPFAQERIALNACREQDASFDTFAFGQEKLYAERLYDAYARNFGFEIRIGRLGNTYGPYCIWNGSRAKAVAAICRKVAGAPYAGTIELWGNGKQTRSFTYVDDAIEGILRLMKSDYDKPVNIASAQTVTIEELLETVCRVAGKIVGWKTVDGPVGVRHRPSDNTLCRKVLNWEPRTGLELGLAMTYPWVAKQVAARELV
jgi:nucleoside-diphosphate-sugar epimerase